MSNVLHLFDGVSFQYFQYLYVLSSPSVQILSWFGSSIPSVMCLLQFFIISMTHFSIFLLLLILEKYTEF